MIDYLKVHDNLVHNLKSAKGKYHLDVYFVDGELFTKKHNPYIEEESMYEMRLIGMLPTGAWYRSEMEEMIEEVCDMLLRLDKGTWPKQMIAECRKTAEALIELFGV